MFLGPWNLRCFPGRKGPPKVWPWLGLAVYEGHGLLALGTLSIFTTQDGFIIDVIIGRYRCCRVSADDSTPPSDSASVRGRLLTATVVSGHSKHTTCVEHRYFDVVYCCSLHKPCE